jgi:hypothetical protein
MTETEFDEAFQDLISRPWPSQKEGARSDAAHGSNAPVEGIYPILAAPRVFPDFGTRPIGTSHPTSHGTHPGTHPRERSLGVSFLGTEPQPNDNEFRSLGTYATVAREGSLVPWCVDINTPDDPAAMGFSRTDMNTTAGPMRMDIHTRAAGARGVSGSLVS